MKTFVKIFAAVIILFVTNGCSSSECPESLDITDWHLIRDVSDNNYRFVGDFAFSPGGGVDISTISYDYDASTNIYTATITAICGSSSPLDDFEVFDDKKFDAGWVTFKLRVIFRGRELDNVTIANDPKSVEEEP